MDDAQASSKPRIVEQQKYQKDESRKQVEKMTHISVLVFFWGVFLEEHICLSL
jgi:hypothetical protein